MYQAQWLKLDAGGETPHATFFSFYSHTNQESECRSAEFSALLINHSQLILKMYEVNLNVFEHAEGRGSWFTWRSSGAAANRS